MVPSAKVSTTCLSHIFQKEYSYVLSYFTNLLIASIKASTDGNDIRVSRKTIIIISIVFHLHVNLTYIIASFIDSLDKKLPESSWYDG